MKNETIPLSKRTFSSRWDYFKQICKEYNNAFLQLKESPNIIYKTLYVIDRGIIALTAPLWIPIGYAAGFISTEYDPEKKGYVERKIEWKKDSLDSFLEDLFKK